MHDRSHNDQVQRSKRHQAIIRAVDGGRRGIADLVELTGASAVTIRRDLEELHELGAVQRVRGGATAVLRRGAEYPFAVRADLGAEAKASVAKLAAAEIEDGMSVYFDNGTTVLAVAALLKDRRIHAMTPSLHCAAMLAKLIDGEVIVPEGPVARDDLSIGGPAVSEAIQCTRFDLAVLGACAADPDHGLTVAGWVDSRNKRAALQSSKRVIMPATAEKFATVATHRFGTLADLDVVIVDAAAPAELLRRLEAFAVDVVVAEPVDG